MSHPVFQEPPMSFEPVPAAAAEPREPLLGEELQETLRRPDAVPNRALRAAHGLLTAGFDAAASTSAAYRTERPSVRSALVVRFALCAPILVAFGMRALLRARDALMSIGLISVAVLISVYALCGRPAASSEIRPDPDDAPIPAPSAPDARAFAMAGRDGR